MYLQNDEHPSNGGHIEFQLLTTAQLAKVLQLSERQIGNLITDNQIPSVTIGRSRRFEFDAVRKFIASKRVEAITA